MKILDRLTKQSKHISGGLVHIEPSELLSLLAVARAAKEASEIIQKYRILARADSHSLRLRKALENLEAVE